MKDYFANPVVPDEDKRELLAKLSKDTGFSENTQNFLGLLVQARRFDVVDEIVTAFENEYCKITDTQVRVGGPFLLGLVRNARRAHTSASPLRKAAAGDDSVSLAVVHLPCSLWRVGGAQGARSLCMALPTSRHKISS